MKLLHYIEIVALFCCTITMQAQDPLDSIPFSIEVDLDETVVVTGQYTPTAVEKTLLPIRIITKAMIQQRAATSLTEVLQQEPSIRMAQDPVLGTTISMNGLEGKYVKVLINGVPMVGRSDGNLDLDRIAVHHIERIEIVQNALSVAYGTNALGGTINIITRRTMNESWSVSLLGQAQSNGLYNSSLQLGAQWKGWSLAWSGSYQHFNGFSLDTLRSLQWNPKRQAQMTARLSYQLPKSSLRASYQFDYLQEKIDNRGVIKLHRFPSLAYARDYEFVTTTQDHSIAVLGYLDKDKAYYLDAFFAYNQYHRAKNAFVRSIAENPSPDTLDPLDSDTTSFGAWNGRITLAKRFGKRWETQTGLDWRYDYTTGARIEGKGASIADYALFSNVRFRPNSQWVIELGARLAYNSALQWPFTYTAGIQWAPKAGLRLQFSYARGIRVPSLKERYLDFVDINHHIKGNPNLKPEYAHNLRLGFSSSKVYGEGHLLRLQSSLFYNYIAQQITLFNYALDSAGNYVMDAQSTQFAYFNLEQYQNWGLNNQLMYQYKGLTIRLGATVIGHYNVLSESYGETIDPFQYTLEWSQEISYYHEPWQASVSLYRRDYDQQLSYSAQENPMTGETTIVQNSLAGYGLMDLTLSKHFFNKSCRLSAGIKNLLNVQTVARSGASSNHQGTSSEANIAMGRLYFIQLQIQPQYWPKKKKRE
ncbi:MAG: TonB-dependent receptor plug domain-containing protein [Aureispira sp.]